MKKTIKTFIFGAVMLLFICTPSSAGSLQQNSESFLSQPVAGNQRYPVSSYANGMHLIVWQEGNETWGGDSQIKGLIIADNGAYDSSFVISNAADVQEKSAITTDGTNFFVVWQDFRNGNYDIYGARVTTTGTVLDANGIAISTGANNQAYPSASFDGTNFIVVWMDARIAPYSYYINAARVSTSGTVLDASGVAIGGPTNPSAISAAYVNDFTYVPMAAVPAIACNIGKCIAVFVGKDRSDLGFQVEPRYVHFNTSSGIVIDRGETIAPMTVGTAAMLAIAANSADQYLACYLATELRANGYFHTGLVFNNVDTSNPPVTKILQPAITSTSGSGTVYNPSRPSVAVNGMGFLAVWPEVQESPYVGPSYAIKTVSVDSGGLVSSANIYSLGSTYRGYPTITIGNANGLLVYEKDAGSGGIQLAGILFSKNNLPWNGTIPDTTSPNVSITAPSGGTASGIITLSADASDNIGVAGVQFKIDGANFGGEDTASPFDMQWDSRSVSNGTHTISAVARDTSGNSATSAGVQVIVQNAYTSVQGGLVAAYSFDEGTGSVILDSSGMGNTGTISGATWTAGKFGNALSFGGNNYVDLGSGPILNFPSGSGFTISGWFKTVDSFGPIVSFRSSADSSPVIDLMVGYDGVISDSGKIEALVRDDARSGFAEITGGAVNDGVWHNFAITRSQSSSNLVLYVDAASQGMAAGQGGQITTSGMRSIGSEQRWANDGFGNNDQRYINGLIDEVRVYNRSLSQAEILADMNTPVSNAAHQGSTANIKISLEGGGAKSIGGILRIMSMANTTIKEINFLANSSGDFAVVVDINETVSMRIFVNGFLARAINNLNLSSTTITFPPLLAGDLDGNNVVNSLDYSVMNTKWYTNDSLSDLNKDGLVNTLDFSLLNKNWMRSGD
jgi:hypothetical protein